MAIYLPHLMFYGGDVFDTSWGIEDACTGFWCFLDGIGDVISGIGDLFQFLTLTGLTSEHADPTLLLGARFVLGLVWLVIIIGFVRGSNQA